MRGHRVQEVEGRAYLPICFLPQTQKCCQE
nr:MAG TPA: hypothetical protein [Caudoviricetes sp.]